jgi:hypothetical protein
MRVETLRPVRLALVAVAHVAGGGEARAAHPGPIVDGMEALVGEVGRQGGALSVGLTAGALAALARHGGSALAALERAIADGRVAPILVPAHGADARRLDPDEHADELRLDREALAALLGEGAMATARRGTLVGAAALDEARAERLAAWGLDYAVVPARPGERGPARRGERLVVFGAAPFPVGEPGALRAMLEAAADGAVVPLLVWLDEGEAAAETLAASGVADDPRVILRPLDEVLARDGMAPGWLPSATSEVDETAVAPPSSPSETAPLVEAVAWLAAACGMPRVVPVDGEALVALDDPAAVLPPRAAVPLLVRRAQAAPLDGAVRAYGAVARACRLLAAECVLTDARPRATAPLASTVTPGLAALLGRAVGDALEVARVEAGLRARDDGGGLATAEAARRRAGEALMAFARAEETLRAGFLAGRSRFGEAARALGEHAAWAARALEAIAEAADQRGEPGSIESWRMRPVASG